MDRNDDLTVAARVKGWEIFTPDWNYLAQFPTMPLGSLCGLSVGLHPAFATPGWVFEVAMPHFSGTDRDEFAEANKLEAQVEYARRAELLNEFLRRVHIAAGNLVPLGALPIAYGAANGEQTVVGVADFATWAVGKGWRLPAEFVALTKNPTIEPLREPLALSSEPSPATTTADDEIAAMFDLVSVATLESMFPAAGKWANWAEHAAANGLTVARIARAQFNPYLAGKWFLERGQPEWSQARLWRVLAKNLPARSADKRDMLQLAGSE